MVLPTESNQGRVGGQGQMFAVIREGVVGHCLLAGAGHEQSEPVLVELAVGHCRRGVDVHQP